MNTTSPNPRWWQVKMVWLVIGGPLVVVVASFITLAIALEGRDDILTGGAAKAGSQRAPIAADMPAVQARNHAATGSR